MRKKINLLCVFLLTVLFMYGQNNREFMIMEYNVENLFDTIDNPYKNDNDFLPTSEREWNSYRYHKKLKDISKVIIATGGWQIPDIIGLCEVENDTCLRDLLNYTDLYRFHCKYIHYESEDPRGIDVAMLYNPKTFTPISSRPIRIIFDDSTRKTRDVLYVLGQIESTKDTIHIFLCHFPSRRGGKPISEPFRMKVASEVRNLVDSIYAEDPKSQIVITGDFNDYPNDKSITEGLRVQKMGSECKQCLIGLDDVDADGTYKFQGQWNFLDQGIVSNVLMMRYNVQYKVVKIEGLLERNEKIGEDAPYRTYRGLFYHGGISDHLPITITFFRK